MKDRKKIRLIVADDHPIFRDRLCRRLALEKDLSVVAQAGDGGEALDLLQQHEADILLLDLKMPHPDSLATLHRLQIAKNKTRVVVVTGSNDKSDFTQAMKYGASGICHKQTSTELLIGCIRKVHAGEIWLDSIATAGVIHQVLNDEQLAMSPMQQKLLATPTRERGWPGLSRRERQILALVAQGFKNQEMAEKLFISKQTVKNHLHNIFEKLGIGDRSELARYGIDDGYPDGLGVRAGGKPRPPYRPPSAAAAEPPEDPFMA